MGKLAILGGEPVLKDGLRPYKSMGESEINAATRVMRSGVLSGFYGSPGDEYFGGPEVLAFEEAWASKFGVRHAVTVNSATSGLIAAIGAVGVGPGDEVIVPPYTMSATVVSPLFYGGIPVFVDIEPDTFCMDLRAVKAAITSKTKVILAVNLFGHPARLAELRRLADEKGIYLIEDNAQGPLAAENGRLAGTIGHIGIFSLNYHKHIHTGEGGVCVTDNDELAQRLKLIRNHGENVITYYDIKNLSNLIGFNFRLTEIQAAIGIEQLKKIDAHVEKRRRTAEGLSDGLRELPGITMPVVRENCRHVYYQFGMRYDKNMVGINRKVFCDALTAEGFPNFYGYVKPLYMLPLFQKRIAIGSHGFPFTGSSTVSYEKGLCPTCEKLYEEEMICFEPCAFDVGKKELSQLVAAFHKVYENRHELTALDKN